MPPEQPIVIPLSKQKIVFMLVVAIALVAVGIGLAFSPLTTQNAYSQTPALLLIIGYAVMIFFGACAVYLLRQLFNTKPGLIIDDMGLYDNSSGVSAGQIRWADIESISVIEIYQQKIILLHVQNPQDYINKQTNELKKKMMTMNHQLYGTPLSISSNALKISFDELLALLTIKLNAFRNK